MGINTDEKYDEVPPQYNEDVYDEYSATHLIADSPDPFAQTRAAQENASKLWRQMLIDNHRKREAERTKRLRSEQIVGIGKALGDLLGAAFAGAGSINGNYTAIVPEAQAPKSVEQVHSLINEGIVNAQDYDKMMLNIALQKSKNDIALAQAMDEMAINAQAVQNQRAWEAAQSDLAWSREVQAANDAREHDKYMQKQQQAFVAGENKKDRSVRLSVARAAMNRQKGFSVADKAILGRVVPKTVVKTNMYGIPETVQNKPTDNELAQYLYREYNKMRDAGLDPNKEADKQWWADKSHNMREAGLDPNKEADIQWWVENKQDISEYIAQGNTYRDVRNILNQ